MTYSRVVISSGHSKYVRGASCPGLLDEVDEVRLVVDRVAEELAARGVDVVTFHDNSSKDQSTNLKTIVNAHNKETRDLDISVHMNAFQKTPKPMGVEVLYLTQQSLAAKISSAIASNGFINRGAKKRTDLSFLNNTEMPAVLLEVCFVDSEADTKIYRDRFDSICASIADAIGGRPVIEEPDEIDEIEEIEPPVEPRVEINVEGDVSVFVNGQQVATCPEPPPPSDTLFHVKGKCSWFGGPNDTTGVSASEGLAFHFEINTANQHLFLPLQPAGTTGLARRLNAKAVRYLAARWDYAVTDKKMLAGDDVALVRAPKTARETTAFPADWGPSDTKTDRVADLSECLMEDLGITTDDIVEVFYPYRGD